MIYPKTLKLESGTDLLDSLHNVAKKENKSGYILSLVGNLSNATLQCPGKEKVTIIKSHLEIISLNGTISPSKCHLHLSVSDGECNIWAGHLKSGTIILKGADILIGFIHETLNKKELISRKIEVDIFIIPDCPWSLRAIRMLRTLQIPHEVKIIDNDNKFQSLNKITNYSSFPQIFIDGEFIGGYSELAEMHAAGKLSN